MSQPYFSPAALQDLLDILDFISRDNSGAAVEYVSHIKAECKFLAANPGLGTLRDDLRKNLRCWSFGKFVICFRPANDGVEIVRVVHGARDLNSLLE